MATAPTKFHHKVRVNGAWRTFVAMWVRVNGGWRPVTHGWTRSLQGWREWTHTVHTPGQPPAIPPTVIHTRTIAGAKIGTHSYSFVTSAYKGKIIYAQIRYTTTTGATINGAGYPSGGYLFSASGLSSGGHTATVDATKFNGATHGVTFSGAAAAHVTRVQLFIRYI